jgi:hypothetical protein
MRSTAIAIAAFILMGASAAPSGEPFTCVPGKVPVCLEIGTVVCERSAMCVAQEAMCFNADSCDSNGFICKSKFDAVVAEGQENVRKYNQLVREINDLRTDMQKLHQRNRNINDCLTFARTLSDAKSCSG